jgi:hypothetical protein
MKDAFVALGVRNDAFIAVRHPGPTRRTLVAIPLGRVVQRAGDRPICGDGYESAALRVPMYGGAIVWTCTRKAGVSRDACFR